MAKAAIKNAKSIETRLPLIGGRLERIAQTFSDRHDLRVIFQSGQCKTDMLGTVTLPTNVAELADEDMDLVWAKVNHESEHVKVQVEAEHAAADRASVAINAAIWERTCLIVTDHIKLLALPPGTRCTYRTTPVGLLNVVAGLLGANLVAMMFNVVEDVRIERRAGERYRGVAQHLKAGRDHAHRSWGKKLAANPRSVDPTYQVGCGIIFHAWGYDYSFLCQESLTVLKALDGFHALLSPETLGSVWDAWNLALCYADALYSAGTSIPDEELKGMMSPGGDSEAPAEEGEEGEEGEGDEGDEGGGGAKRDKSAESPDMAPVSAEEVLKALRALKAGSLTLTDTESPIHEAIDEAIIRQAGAAPTNTAKADGMTDYTVHPGAAKKDMIATPAVTAATLSAAERIAKGVSKESATLSARMRTLLATRSQSTKVYAQRHGRLDRRAMWRANIREAGRPVDNIRTRLVPGETHDVAIKLLGDCSGSMAGSKFALMQQGILLLGDLLDSINRTTPNSIQLSATGFTAGNSITGSYTHTHHYGRLSPIEHYNWCDWDENWSQVRSRVAAEVRLWENADPDSVKWALQELRCRRAKRRILMVLSDGQPAAPGNSAKMRRELKACIAAAISAGIEVWGFGIMDDSVRHYYPNHRTCNNLGQLADMILEVAPHWFNLHRHA